MNISGIGQSLVFKSAILGNSDSSKNSNKQEEINNPLSEGDMTDIGMIYTPDLKTELLETDVFKSTANVKKENTASQTSIDSNDSNSDDNPYKYGIAE